MLKNNSRVRDEFLEALHKALERPATREEALIFASANSKELLFLLDAALTLKLKYTGRIVTYSRKVFVPLTNLCRNKCAYCGFRREPHKPGAGFMSFNEAMSIVKLGEKLGAKEVLVSTGEKPETKYDEARRYLKKMGYSSTVEYVKDFEEKVLKETEHMMPHTNIGVLSKKEMMELKPLNASMGLMLETISERLTKPGMPHENSPWKHPKVRLKMIKDAGELKIPFTTGILIGIGETWEERIDSLLELRKINREHDHIQEIIIQNFKPEPNTPMELYPSPTTIETLKTIAIARLVFHNETSIQTPPNLNIEAYQTYLLAGINDWGGISPVTPDFVNMEYPWPKIVEVRKATEEVGFTLRERLPIYPKYIFKQWFSRALESKIIELTDDRGLVKNLHEHVINQFT